MAEVASRAVVLAEGELVADRPARQVVSHSPIFAPQMAEVFAPHELLTVAEVVPLIDAHDRQVRSGSPMTPREAEA